MMNRYATNHDSCSLQFTDWHPFKERNSDQLAPLPSVIDSIRRRRRLSNTTFFKNSEEDQLTALQSLHRGDVSESYRSSICSSLRSRSNSLRSDFDRRASIGSNRSEVFFSERRRSSGFFIAMSSPTLPNQKESSIELFADLDLDQFVQLKDKKNLEPKEDDVLPAQAKFPCGFYEDSQFLFHTNLNTTGPPLLSDHYSFQNPEEPVFQVDTHPRYRATSAPLPSTVVVQSEQVDTASAPLPLTVVVQSEQVDFFVKDEASTCTVMACSPQAALTLPKPENQITSVSAEAELTNNESLEQSSACAMKTQITTSDETHFNTATRSRNHTEIVSAPDSDPSQFPRSSFCISRIQSSSCEDVDEPSGRKRKGNGKRFIISQNAREQLRRWLAARIPLAQTPEEREWQELEDQTGLQRAQIVKWRSNNRTRFYTPKKFIIDELAERRDCTVTLLERARYEQAIYQVMWTPRSNQTNRKR